MNIRGALGHCHRTRTTRPSHDRTTTVEGSKYVQLHSTGNREDANVRRPISLYTTLNPRVKFNRASTTTHTASVLGKRTEDKLSTFTKRLHVGAKPKDTGIRLILKPWAQSTACRTTFCPPLLSLGFPHPDHLSVIATADFWQLFNGIHPLCLIFHLGRICNSHMLNLG